MKVLIGLSGGVDSSVAALILKQQGYEVIGATMSIWGKNGIAKAEGKHNACYGPDEAEDIETASQLAAQLDIPYHVIDCGIDCCGCIICIFCCGVGCGTCRGS